MTSIVLTFAAVLTVVYCSTDRLPPPTNLAYNLPDPITVNLTWSWQRPRTLPENCTIKYKIKLPGQGTKRTNTKNFTHHCPTNDHPLIYTVQTVDCDGRTSSETVSIEVKEMSQDKVVKDFTCVLHSSGMNCSWIPEDRSLDLTFSYCPSCSSTSHSCRPLKDCNQLYTSGTRHGCFMKEVDSKEMKEIRFLVKSANGMDVVKPHYVLPTPKLSVTEINNRLKLSWTPSIFEILCGMYELCFTECGGKLKCYNVSSTSHDIPYHENCMYRFRVWNYCHPSLLLSSDWSEDLKYGTNKPPDATLTVVAIVVPIILFICITLSCYCFRKHSDIIFPNTPDPSAILKDLMSGNKEHEAKPEGLYTPLPEAVERCTISHVTENRRLLESP